MSNQIKSKLSLNVETIISLSSLERVVGGADGSAVVRQTSLCDLGRNQAVAGKANLGDVVRATAKCIGSCFCPVSVVDKL